MVRSTIWDAPTAAAASRSSKPSEPKRLVQPTPVAGPILLASRPIRIGELSDETRTIGFDDRRQSGSRIRAPVQTNTEPRQRRPTKSDKDLARIEGSTIDPDLATKSARYRRPQSALGAPRSDPHWARRSPNRSDLVGPFQSKNSRIRPTIRRAAYPSPYGLATRAM